MFNKFVDLLREVFWLKPAKKKSVRRKPATKKAPKKAVKKTVKPKPAPAKKAPAKPVKVATKPPKPLKVVKPKEPAIDPNLVVVGEITHYFERINVSVVKITNGSILIGDRLTIYGEKTKFVQKVWSMQIESSDVKVAKKGQLVGLKVDKPVQVGDQVYK